MQRNDPCWCGSNKKWKKCHYPSLPIESGNLLQKEYFDRYGIILKTDEQIEGIRRACRVTAEILHRLAIASQEGVTTEDLDILSRSLHKEFGATPAPLGYGTPPYPKTICTSLNDVICHGIPDKRPLQKGDIMNIDVSSIVDGYFGDTSCMVAIGPIREEATHLLSVVAEALQRGIGVCRPGALISDIGRAIEDFATSQGCSVVNQFIGHGVGIAFHEAPEVPHHYNRLDIPMAPGMTFTIEPMINLGKREAVVDASDHWTARTKDGSLSAQKEHTVLITKTGVEILTLF